MVSKTPSDNFIQSPYQYLLNYMPSDSRSTYIFTTVHQLLQFHYKLLSSILLFPNCQKSNVFIQLTTLTSVLIRTRNKIVKEGLAMYLDTQPIHISFQNPVLNAIMRFFAFNRLKMSVQLRPQRSIDEEEERRNRTTMMSLRLLSSRSSRTQEMTGRFATGSRALGTSCNWFSDE